MNLQKQNKLLEEDIRMLKCYIQKVIGKVKGLKKKVQDNSHFEIFYEI